jgi:RNA polymerase sigma-70 factor, ECF subfamily
MSAKRQRPAAAAPEPQLLQRLADGDLSALGELYDRHAEDVRRFVVRTTGSEAAADDVTQDAFIALVDAAKRYDGDHTPRAFLIGIAGKLVLRRRRSLAVSLRVLADVFGRGDASDTRTPEAAAMVDEELARYRAALGKLSEPKRLTLIMADVEGLSGPEIAKALDIPIGTVWTRLHHARYELRRALGRKDTR